jgi:uncharacterized membrane protein YbaN (DUF454 family)
MANSSLLQTATATTIGRDLWLVELPHAIHANDEQCRAIAARLLHRTPARSVTIDRHRRKALVRVGADRTKSVGAEAIQTALHAATTGNPVEASAHAEVTPVVSWIDAATQAICYIKLPAAARGWRKAALLMAGGMSLMLGLLGVVLPGLPTTPFVLLASVCLLRSSPRLHEKLLKSRLFGGVLRDWHLHRGVRPHVRYKAMVVIAIVLGASLLLTSIPLAAKAIIGAIAACGILYVARLPEVVEIWPVDTTTTSADARATDESR